MMKFFNSLGTFLLLYSFTAFAQAPELVIDFNPGGDGFNRFNPESIALGEDLFFRLISSELGEEIGILKDGQLSILKDINPGEASSDPNNFILFKNKIFFVARDAENGRSVWVTDGTEENTKLFFTLGPNEFSNPRGFIISRSGWLYYTYGRSLYRTDGDLNEKVFEGVQFFTQFRQRSNNYTQYKDEIAFLNDEGRFVELYAVEGDSVIALATTDIRSDMVNIFGLNEIGQGLVFGVENPFSAFDTGTYYYDAQLDSLTTIDVAGSYARRIHPFTKDASLSWVGGEGYFTINGVSGQEQLLFSTNNNSFTQGEPILNAVLEDKMIFHASEGSFGDDFIIYTDGTTSGTSQLFEADPFLSNILIHDDIAFIAHGTSNGFRPKLYAINMNDGSFENFYNFDDRSLDLETVQFLGVVGNKLYIIISLDRSVGRELYSFELDFATNIENLPADEFSIWSDNHSFKVNANSYFNLNLNVFSIDGKLIQSRTIETNSNYQLPACNGLCILMAQHANQVKIHKYIKTD